MHVRSWSIYAGRIGAAVLPTFDVVPPFLPSTAIWWKRSHDSDIYLQGCTSRLRWYTQFASFVSFTLLVFGTPQPRGHVKPQSANENFPTRNIPTRNFLCRNDKTFKNSSRYRDHFIRILFSNLTNAASTFQRTATDFSRLERRNVISREGRSNKTG